MIGGRLSMDCFTFDPIAFQDICPGCHSVFRVQCILEQLPLPVCTVYMCTLWFALLYLAISLLSDTLQKYQGSHSMLHCSIFVAHCSVHWLQDITRQVIWFTPSLACTDCTARYIKSRQIIIFLMQHTFLQCVRGEVDKAGVGHDHRWYGGIFCEHTDLADHQIGSSVMHYRTKNARGRVHVGIRKWKKRYFGTYIPVPQMEEKIFWTNPFQCRKWKYTWK